MSIIRRSAGVPWISLCVLALLSPTLLADSRPANVRAHDWVQTHAGALPQSFEAFAQYPIQYQREIFKVLTPNTKARIMAERIQTALAAENGLTPEQRRLLERALTVATPQAYAGDPALRQQAEAVCAESAKVLPASLRAILQPGVAPRHVGINMNVSAARVRLTEFVHEVLAVHADVCSCSAGSYCSCGGCQPGYGPGWEICSPGPNNCGCFWQYPCDGFGC